MRRVELIGEQLNSEVDDIDEWIIIGSYPEFRCVGELILMEEHESINLAIHDSEFTAEVTQENAPRASTGQLRDSLGLTCSPCGLAGHRAA